MVYIFLLSIGVICSFLLQVNGHCTTSGCKCSQEEIDDVLVTTSVMLSVGKQRNERSSTSSCEDQDGDEKACPSGFDFLPGADGCFKVIFQSLNWSETDKACRGVMPGAHLVAITNAAKQEAIAKYLKREFNTCPSGFDFLPEADGCFKVIFQSLSWSDADKACRGVKPGVHLVAITNAAKQQAIAKYLEREFNKSGRSACPGPFVGAEQSAWIGGQRQNSACSTSSFVWKTLDSIEIFFNYVNWYPGEPNCLGDEYCVHVSKGINYTWNDSICGRQTCSVCEYDMTSR